MLGTLVRVKPAATFFLKHLEWHLWILVIYSVVLHLRSPARCSGKTIAAGLIRNRLRNTPGWPRLSNAILRRRCGTSGGAAGGTSRGSARACGPPLSTGRTYHAGPRPSRPNQDKLGEMPFQMLEEKGRTNHHPVALVVYATHAGLYVRETKAMTLVSRWCQAH